MEYKIGTDARCAVIGYGSWATAIVGLLAANGRRVGWYVRNPEVLESLCSDGRNPRYLNDLEFDRNSIAPSSDLDAVVRDADIVILATPSAYLKDFLAPLTVPLRDKFVVSAIKGIVPGDYQTVVEYIHDHYGLSYRQIGLVTGPSHAEEVSRGKLSYLTVVCADPENARRIGERFAGENIRLSYSADLYGVEYAAILKNIYALSVGIAVGLGYGDNFLAVLIANAAGEMTRFLEESYPDARNTHLQPQPPAGAAHRPRLYRQERPERDDDGRRGLFRGRLHPSHQLPPPGRHAHRRHGLPGALRGRLGAQVHAGTDNQINLVSDMMKNVKLDIAKTGIEISADIEAKAQTANALLHSGKGAGNDFLGWVHLPSSISENEIDAIRKEAAKLRSKADVVVCIGIGGSYLGAKAVLEAMSDPFKLLYKEQKDPTVIFAGQNISEDYTAELLAALKEHSIAAIVISKSGTTTEPAIAFRLIKAEIEKRYGKKEAAERIVAITDKARGALKTLATQEGYPTFVIPDDVGGRFSVLTPVGLLPLAVAGVDIAALVRGAQEMEKATAEGVAFKENPAAVYAAVRNILYDGGKKIEILGSYEPKLQYINEWWKQLYGESEGKQGKGIFPASVTLTADLHSMGQYIQDGERTLFETIISVAKPAAEVLIEADGENLDGLNFLAGKRISEVNRMAELGVQLAHVDGGVPNIRIEIPEISESVIGGLLYFFEKACGISGYMLGVNPFDQPGVEAYKKNMFALLDKPGYEEASKAIKARL